MSTEYAGELFDTEHAALMACAHDWMTAGGMEPLDEALESYWDDPEGTVDELHDLVKRGDWSLPSDDERRSDVADILKEWEAEARGQVLAEIREQMDMSQPEFAQHLRIAGGQQAISKYERGVIAPSRQTVMLAKMMSENPELWEGDDAPSPAAARRLWTDRNNDGEGYGVGDEDDDVNGLADELGELVRSAESGDDVAVYRTAPGRFVGVADANGPWAVDLG